MRIALWLTLCDARYDGRSGAPGLSRVTQCLLIHRERVPAVAVRYDAQGYKLPACGASVGNDWNPLNAPLGVDALLDGVALARVACVPAVPALPRVQAAPG